MVYARVDRRDSKVLRSSHSGAVHLMSSKRTSPLRTRTPSTAAPTALRAPAPTTFKTQRRLSPPITCSYHLCSLYAVCTASAAAMPACYACSYTLALTTPAPTIFATTKAWSTTSSLRTPACTTSTLPTSPLCPLRLLLPPELPPRRLALPHQVRTVGCSNCCCDFMLIAHLLPMPSLIILSDCGMIIAIFQQAKHSKG